jgi:hypothetical protein
MIDCFYLRARPRVAGRSNTAQTAAASRQPLNLLSRGPGMHLSRDAHFGRNRASPFTTLVNISCNSSGCRGSRAFSPWIGGSVNP